MGTSLEALRAANEARIDAEAEKEGSATQQARQWSRQRRHGVSHTEKKQETARTFLARL